MIDTSSSANGSNLTTGSNPTSPSIPAPGSLAGRHYHFIGIGGIGMSSMARLLLSWGAVVSGSDRSDSEMMETLRAEGARVAVGHSARNLEESLPDVVVYSKAVPGDNPELLAARRHQIRTIHRAEFLGELMAARKAICICGTHGKTTTTAMLTTILVEAGLDPAVMLGGVYDAIGGNVRNGSGPYFVAETCEAYGSFLSIYPDMAVVTNIEPDHLDAGTTFEDIRDRFRTFLQRVPEEEVVIACAESPEVVRLLPELRARIQLYGIQASPTASSNTASKTTSRTLHWAAIPTDSHSYQVWRQGKPVADLNLQAPGAHNVLNALAAIAAAAHLGVSPQEGARILSHFTGVDRRFTIRGEAGGMMVVDDYAHHPTEIRATLAAARELICRRDKQGLSRIIAAFQPHLYSRTAIFMKEFTDSFREADLVVLTEIYAAREQPLPGITGEKLAEQVRGRWPEKPVFFAPTLDELVSCLADLARPGDLVLTLGAGDITTVGPALLHQLMAQPAEAAS